MLHLKQALWYTCKHNINVFVLHPFPPQGVKQFIHRSEGSDGEDYIGLKQIEVLFFSPHQLVFQTVTLQLFSFQWEFPESPWTCEI